MRKSFIRSLILLVPFLAALATAHARLEVVSTIPDFGAIAEEIGGENVNVTSLARGTEDAHFVTARPSYIRVLNRADVLLEGGADLEIGWLPPLVNNARNSKIRPGAPGHVDMSQGIELRGVPEGRVDRSMGDVHPAGNPHYWLDPANGKIMADHLTAVFSRLDSENTEVYRSNLQKFNERMDEKLTEWKDLIEPYRGTKVVTYHKTFEYFAHRFGLEVVDQLEPKPGVEPSPTHLNRLIPTMRDAGVELVLIEPNRPRRTPEHVASAAGAKVVVIPGMVGGHREAMDYFSLFDHSIGQIIDALKDSG